MAKIKVKESEVTILSINENDYISLTDIAKHKSDDPFLVINHWMRNRNTIEYLGLWETIFNPDFKPTEFGRFKMEAGLNAFTLSPQKWTNATGAIGIVTRAGRYGGTYAHKDIAFKFASWISVEFELYMVKEFQRLKEYEQSKLGWSAKRELARINYHIHTSAVSRNLIPEKVTANQLRYVYASEADLLNVALFGMTAKEWRESHPEAEGNIRDYATINELICLSNMESMNSVLIESGMDQSDRLIRLNETAIRQMEILTSNVNRNLMK
ncbi:MAG: KilA-N domain-containing protein [Bacteroidales bacterium]|nr:KilA-N domain-containing protein [Bacteroidales bacterium]